MNQTLDSIRHWGARAGIILWGMALLSQCLAAIGIALWGLLLLTLSACGGGGGGSVAGVGTGGSGLAQGTISGFGSIIVAGVEYDDSSATVQQDDGTGALGNADLKLGQNVRLVLDASGKAKTVAVMAQLLGPVTVAPDSQGNFRVLGQWVRLAGSAADTTQGTPGVLSGFGAAAIAKTDEVEVHGTWVFDATLATSVLVASRVEKLVTVPDPVQLSGLVQSVSGSTIRLNGAAGLTVQAASLPSGVAAGHLVRVWAARTALTTLSTNTLVASRVVDTTLTATEVSDKTLRLSGEASSYNPATRTVEVQGVTVQLPAGLQVDESALAKGKFVSLEIQRTGTSLVATSATQRGSAGSVADLGQSVSIKAVANGIAWTASPVRFTLRGIDVRAAQTVIAPACRQATANADVLVEVKGRLGAGTDIVDATEVKCTVVASSAASAPVTAASASGSSASSVDVSGVTVDRTGTVTQLNLSANTFVLQVVQGSATANVNVQWDAQTYFSSEFIKRPESLTGQKVEVEGVSQTGILRARKVKRSD